MYIAASNEVMYYSSYFEYSSKDNETLKPSFFRVLCGQFCPGFFVNPVNFLQILS